MMIKGFIETSLIDYPGKVCSVLFLGGCSFRCGYCHNPEIVFNNTREADPKQIFNFLESKKEWVDGVTITGGEPTIHQDLPQLIKQIRELGLLVKLDTNGSNPLMLKSLINDKMLDYIAMDIKAPLRLYPVITKSNIDIELIKQSINLIRSSGLDYEFRTTVSPSFIGKKELLEICDLIKGSRKYALQQFRPIKTLDPSFPKESYNLNELNELVKLAEPYFGRVELRT